MKRFLSWLVLVVCYIIFCVAVKLDGIFILWTTEIYSEQSGCLWLVVLLGGGTICFLLIVSPILYGARLTYIWCERISESKKGTRYIVMGVLIVVSCVLEALLGFRFRDIVIGLYGVQLIDVGIKNKPYVLM